MTLLVCINHSTATRRTFGVILDRVELGVSHASWLPGGGGMARPALVWSPNIVRMMDVGHRRSK
jgi:hypothetical protein